MSHEMGHAVSPNQNYFMTILSIRAFNTIMCATKIAVLFVVRSSFLSSSSLLYWTGHEHATLKHCKLIFENSTVAAKYSVADLIKHINKCPLLFCCKWRGKKLSYNFIDVLCVLAKGKPFSWFSSSYSVLRIPLLQSMAYICHLADLFFVFDIFSHKIMTTMFIYSNTDEC